MTIDEFIHSWWGREGGAERSNLAPFIYELCDALNLPRPGHASAGKLGVYEFDGTLPGGSFRSLKGTGFIDLYKRGHFVLEAKQSQLPAERQSELGLFEPDEFAPRAPSGARYDKLMADARAQAEHYAKNLPGDHPPAPFIIVLDIGRAFEILFDYTGNGRGYGFFPDKQSYRIELPDLRDAAVADRLRAIWADPDSINPRFQSADVTRKIALRLAEVSKWLEETQRAKTAGLSDWERSLAIEETALFLMRILFCMFAEDVSTAEAELLPRESFKKFLERSLYDDDHFESGLSDLWRIMASEHVGNRFALALQAKVRYFNGKLFESTTTYRLGQAAQGELLAAANHNWRKVEPAIFGTLLEQALTKEERAKLGAHYTPRPYVERLVQATILDVLEAEWAEASNPPRNGEGDHPKDGGGGPPPDATVEDIAAALAAACAFHDRLANLRILDPACGTGNFLYVAMESLQHLENKVIERIQQLGGEASARVGPHQFHGLELNPRAAKIAELVLWIGWLRFRIANDPRDIRDPVLGETANINFGQHGGFDAVLVRKESGEVDFENPRVPAWPEADFIIGNPPFIGGQDLREELGSDYAEALWAANPRVGGGADFVMQWWDHAALLLTRPSTRLRRFGFVTTNSITQDFSRRVILRYLQPVTSEPDKGEGPPSADGVGDSANRALSLIYAIPNHPWLKPQPIAIAVRSKKRGSGGPAAVRIAMTVAEAGLHSGIIGTVVAESALDSDDPKVDIDWSGGRIHADLSTGTDVLRAKPLRSNQGICHDGVKLHGKGFAITDGIAGALGLGHREGLERFIRPYRNGKDLSSRPPSASRDKLVIDFYGLDEKAVRQNFPEVYEHLLRTVRATRLEQYNKSPTADAKAYLAHWWLMGKPRPEMRPAMDGLSRYIGTVDTAKHRIFQLLDPQILCDDGVVLICDDRAETLGVLSSRVHSAWALRVGGWMGVGNDPRYFKSKTFDPFPFPDPTPEQRTAIADLAEELDATRKLALAEVPGLTMTELYNLRGQLRSGARMSKADQDRATAARAGIVNRLHEQLDAAVTAAYGWPADLAPSEIVARLVALNAERAAEEKAGLIRWLRPDYQEPRFGKKGRAPTPASKSTDAD